MKADPEGIGVHQNGDKVDVNVDPDDVKGAISNKDVITSSGLHKVDMSDIRIIFAR